MQVNGFSVLRIPLSSGSPFCREILCKRHQGPANDPNTPGDRTLFLVHLDPSLTEEDIQQCFTHAFGEVEAVHMKQSEKQLKGGNHKQDDLKELITLAHVVFKSPNSLQAAVKAMGGSGASSSSSSKKLPPVTLHNVTLQLPKGTLQGYVTEGIKYSNALVYRDAEVLQNAVDQYMLQHDIAKEEERMRRNMQQKTDDDGFTVVSGAGAVKAPDGTVVRAIKPKLPPTGVFAITTGAAQTAAAETGETASRKKKKRKAEETLDFYKFQMREKKRNELADMRRKNEEDKGKVEQMRQAKKFRIKEKAVDA
eukprot:GDKI01002323.1.p1 GENE.GDKI01002323.1~~GDKI01002323.1.p1  ORF type:complete len:309 (+),score=110.44 GDKI01002323.1:105-1031(+)